MQVTHICQVTLRNVDREAIPQIGGDRVVQTAHVDNCQRISDLELGSHAVDKWLVSDVHFLKCRIVVLFVDWDLISTVNKKVFVFVELKELPA